MAPMKWKKLGRVFVPAGDAAWMHSHAANPVALIGDGELVRIYFSTRDVENRSSVGWVEIDLKEPTRILRVSPRPALSPGTIGCFDDSGASIGCILRRGGELWLYYMGWNLGVTVPWRNAIGLAVSRDGGDTFERVSLAPVMDRSQVDPYTLSYPWVIEKDGTFRAWYGSNLSWGAEKADMDHMIKAAHSRDGVSWIRDGKVVIIPTSDAEFAFARPCVVADPGLYRMWYAFRGERYRIGYAESVDGENWIRKDDEVGIDVSPGKWDGESVEYPSIFDHGGKRYMLYCGDGYGRTGFGLAVLEGM
ncbi:MAG: hypothetical protein P4L72_17150 [Parvibaculum sp.]|uniref:hypothetical protein n=1 Tax=Parvibaculum sp. TaxID=2024848 RepID=UPI0028438324|nr:hypothetical protein [Parvibaculum sp.]MDR3500944.1 hypothetical protein [Parvibaculum sp.]